jgi:hypothetical protein
MHSLHLLALCAAVMIDTAYTHVYMQCGARTYFFVGSPHHVDSMHKMLLALMHAGMILWSKGRRAVSDATAVAIAAAARRHGAEPIGVFVDEDAPTIAKRCAAAGVRIAQLHGDGARAALPGLPLDLQASHGRMSQDVAQCGMQPNSTQLNPGALCTLHFQKSIKYSSDAAD